MFEDLQNLPADPILGLMTAFRADPNPNKVDLGVGVYRNDAGATPVLRAVKEAERRIEASEDTKAYLPQMGDPTFNRTIVDLLFGADHDAVTGQRVRSVQTPGGCGALRIGAEVIKRSRPDARVWVSSPTWPNHIPLIGGTGLEFKEYPYYDRAAHRIDFDAMLTALQQAKANDVVLLHGCCHNPSGADLTPEQWHEVAALAAHIGFTPFIDIAYQGLGQGLQEDALGIRWMAAKLPELLVASSCSKNFGLYRERTGAIMFVAAQASQAERTQSQAAHAARQIYSMPPAHGALIAGAILESEELRALWEEELTEMRDRINGMRSLLVKKLNTNNVGVNFDFIEQQRGMFSFLGIKPEQVQQLREQYGIYMVDSTRINVAGVNSGNIDYLAASVLAVL
ncbi:MAG: aromatic amino acid transaminase [Pseudomonadales bacterium]